MDIALLGGTGDIGEGLALRLAADTTHDVIVGSRDAAKAAASATAYTETLASIGVDRSVVGMENTAAAARAEIAVLAVPPYHVGDTV